MVARLAKSIDDLSIQDQCDFVRTLYFIEDEAAEQMVASQTQLEFATSLELILEKVEPYLASNIELLTNEDLINCFIGFSHPHCQKRLPILDSIEDRLIAAATLDQLSLNENIESIYELS